MLCAWCQWERSKFWSALLNAAYCSESCYQHDMLWRTTQLMYEKLSKESRKEDKMPTAKRTTLISAQERREWLELNKVVDRALKVVANEQDLLDSFPRKRKSKTRKVSKRVPMAA